MLFVGPTDPRTTPAIYARPRLPSLGERATEEFATKTGLRSTMTCAGRSVYGCLLRSPLIDVPQLYRSPWVNQEVFEIPLGCEMKNLVM